MVRHPSFCPAPLPIPAPANITATMRSPRRLATGARLSADYGPFWVRPFAAFRPRYRTLWGVSGPFWGVVVLQDYGGHGFVNGCPIWLQLRDCAPGRLLENKTKSNTLAQWATNSSCIDHPPSTVSCWHFNYAKIRSIITNQSWSAKPKHPNYC